MGLNPNNIGMGEFNSQEPRQVRKSAGLTQCHIMSSFNPCGDLDEDQTILYHVKADAVIEIGQPLIRIHTKL